MKTLDPTQTFQFSIHYILHNNKKGRILFWENSKGIYQDVDIALQILVLYSGAIYI